MTNIIREINITFYRGYMRYITYEDKHIISQIAQLHETELERQHQDYQQTTLSVALREEMLLNGLYHGTDVLITHIVDDTLIGVIWGAI